MKTSIYHFFAELLLRRGYFAQLENIEDFDYPNELIAGRSAKTFPDIVLHYDGSADLPGGEFIELKTANSFNISSFNSTIPTAQKSMGTLSDKLAKELRANGETFESYDMRDVYYLVVGRKKTLSAPLTKVCLVHGSFFETVPIRDVIIGCALDALKDSDGDSHYDIAQVFADDSDEDLQSRFAATRSIPGASIKLRFRVMCEVDPAADLMKQNRFPEIKSDSISFITKLHSFEAGVSAVLSDWYSAKEEIHTLTAAVNLSTALDDVSPDLTKQLRIGTLQHPLNGNYFIAQAAIH